jgi:TRAP-type mannitol/chloroaromatic compound transport system substrate-binding protein
MKRRDFVTTSALGATAALAAVSSFPTPALSQNKRVLRLVTTWPKGFPGLGTGAQRFADRVTNATNGRLTVKLFAAGELVPPFESFNAVMSGTADMYHGADYYWVGKSKAYAFFTGVPMGLMADEQDAWINNHGGQELWDELGSEFGIKHLPCGNTGVQMGGWFNKEINSIDDMKGLKMRIPGLGGEVLNRIGASAISLPGGEIFAALQSGTIDATEWVGPYNDLAFGFYKVAKYYYWPGFHEPSATLGVGINKKVWDSLPKDDQHTFTNAALAENNFMYSEFNARNTDALNTLVNKHNVQLRRMPNEVLNEIGRASGEVVGEVGDIGGTEGKIYRSFIDFRKKAMYWTKLSTTAFSEARNLPFPYAK